MREAQNCASRCYRCDAHVSKPTKTGFKTPLTEFHCDIGRKSVFRAIRQVLLAKILTHVKLNKSMELGRVRPEKRFRQGCLSFFLSDVLGRQSPRIFEAERIMEVLKFFLDLQCE